MTSTNRASLRVTYWFLASVLLGFTALAGAAIAQNPVPLINQPLVPDSAVPGGAGFTLTVNGTGFVSGSVVNWNGGALATTFVSGSQLAASVPASDIAKVSTTSVTVVNPGTARNSNVVFFPVMVPNSFVSFSRAHYSAGSAPNSLAVGDFNQDGKLDVATSNYNGNTVSILLGKGDGTFQPHADYATELGPDTVVVGDFNSDGKLDLAVRNQSSNTVSVLLGNGDGTFQPAVNFAVGSGNAASRLTVGDFNGDGKLDLVATNHSDNTISVLLGNGDGTFQNQVVYAAGSGAAEIGVGDLNRDGKLDLVVDNGNDVIAVLLGNGDGTFQAPVTYATAHGPSWVNIADLNGDGVPDLIVSASGSRVVSVLLGNGDGTFQPHLDFAVPSGVLRSAVADLNGDGKLDVLVVPWNASDVVSILLGNGDGTFQPPVTYATGSNPEFVAVGDFNGDGRLDLAIADNNASAVSVLLQDETIMLSPPSLNFGLQLLGSGNTKNVTLTNTGTVTLNITNIAITGEPDFTQNNDCGPSLPPGGQCVIGVTFNPTQLGPGTAALTITDNSAGSPQSVPLSGTGVVSGPNSTLSPTSLTFATQLVNTASSAQSVTLTNYGTATLSITSIATSGDFGQTNTCGSSLAAGASCTISVTFKPSQIGSRTGTLSITDNAPGSPQTVSLAGVGTVVELNPNSLNFGFVVRLGRKSLTTTLTNTGSAALSISGISINGANSGDFSQVNTCGTGIAAGATCTITVTFKPEKVGRRSAYLSISDNGGGSPQQVPLSGTGFHFCRPPFCWSMKD